MINSRINTIKDFEKKIGVNEIMKKYDKDKANKHYRSVCENIWGEYYYNTFSTKGIRDYLYNNLLYRSGGSWKIDKVINLLIEILTAFCIYAKFNGESNKRRMKIVDYILKELNIAINVRKNGKYKKEIEDKELFFALWSKMIEEKAVKMTYKEAAKFIEKHFDTGYKISTINRMLLPRVVEEYNDWEIELEKIQ